MKSICKFISIKSFYTLIWVLLLTAYLQFNSHAGQYDRYVVGTVTKVKDGDTVNVRVANTDEILEVRLYGINAPERSEPLYDEATKFLSKLVLGKLVELYITDRGRYKRYLTKVYCNSKYINLMLVSAGLAIHYTNINDASLTCSPVRKHEV